jgi:hypothetical protein
MCYYFWYHMYFQFWHNVCTLYHGNMFITLVKEHHYLKVPYVICSFLNIKRCISLLWKVYSNGLCFILHYLLRIIFPWGPYSRELLCEMWSTIWVTMACSQKFPWTTPSLFPITLTHALHNNYLGQSPFFRCKNSKCKDIMTIVGPYVWILISS